MKWPFEGETPEQQERRVAYAKHIEAEEQLRRDNAKIREERELLSGERNGE